MDTTEAVAPAATPTDTIEPTGLHVEVTSQEFSNGTKLVVCSNWPPWPVIVSRSDIFAEWHGINTKSE